MEKKDFQCAGKLLFPLHYGTGVLWSKLNSSSFLLRDLLYLKYNSHKDQYFVAITMKHKMNLVFCAIYRIPKYIFVNMKKL